MPGKSSKNIIVVKNGDFHPMGSNPKQNHQHSTNPSRFLGEQKRGFALSHSPLSLLLGMILPHATRAPALPVTCDGVLGVSSSPGTT